MNPKTLLNILGSEVPKKRPGRKRGWKLNTATEPYVKTEVMETYRTTEASYSLRQTIKVGLAITKDIYFGEIFTRH